MAEWRKILLKDVISVRKTGVPGTIIVFGESAEPIMTGSGASDILMAAAQYEDGRVVVFSHSWYSKNFLEHRNETRNRNIQEFLAGRSVADHELVDITHARDLNSDLLKDTKILVWNGDDAKPDKFFDELETFVNQGGGVVCGATPWGFLQFSPASTLDDLPMSKFLDKVGMCFSPYYIRGGGPFKVSENHADLGHLQNVLETLSLEPGKASSFQDVFTRGLQALPLKHQQALSGLISTAFHNNSSSANWIPTSGNPVKTAEGKVLMSMKELLCRVEKEPSKMPGVEGFPGDFAETPKYTTRKVKVISDRANYHPCGYYALPGVEIHIKATGDVNNIKKWSVMIGCHSDDLHHKDRLLRWPRICEKQKLTGANTKLYNPFGGSVYLISPDGESVIQVELCGGIHSPNFNLTDPDSVNRWEERREDPGLWADISGEFITFTLPSACIRDLDDPTDVMHLWDEVTRAHCHLKGCDIQKREREWIVFDIQPSIGYMHSGYPVVAQLDYPPSTRCGEIKDFVLDYETQRTQGRWGVYHELGHNMQEGMWTFDGTKEVTVNIFTLHAMEKIPAISSWIHPWIQNQMKNITGYLKGSCSYGAWQALPGVGIVIYAQLAHHFGWGAYRKIFRQYDGLPRSGRPQDNQQKIDEWVKRFSMVVGYNLMPLFEFWGIPFSDKVAPALESLDPFLPDDEIMQIVPDRVEMIIKKYQRMIRDAKKVHDSYSDQIGEPFAPYPHIKIID